MVSGRKKPVEGRRERRRRETRTALSRAAMHLIRERGIYGARIEDILIVTADGSISVNNRPHDLIVVPD